MSTRKTATSNGFLLFKDQLPILENIPNENLGEAIKLLLENFDNMQKIEVNPLTNMAYELIATNIRRYREQSNKAREDGLRGGNPTLKGTVKGTVKGGLTVPISNKTIQDNTRKENTIIEITEEDMKNYKLTDVVKPSLKELKMCTRALIKNKKINEEFIQIVDAWLDHLESANMLKNKYVTNKAFSVFIDELRENSSGHPSVAKRMVEKAIINGWKSVPALDYEEKKKYMPYNMYM